MGIDVALRQSLQAVTRAYKKRKGRTRCRLRTVLSLVQRCEAYFHKAPTDYDYALRISVHSKLLYGLACSKRTRLFSAAVQSFTLELPQKAHPKGQSKLLRLCAIAAYNKAILCIVMHDYEEAEQHLWRALSDFEALIHYAGTPTSPTSQLRLSFDKEMLRLALITLNTQLKEAHDRLESFKIIKEGGIDPELVALFLTRHKMPSGDQRVARKGLLGKIGLKRAAKIGRKHLCYDIPL